jgi:hypothetical protein
MKLKLVAGFEAGKFTPDTRVLPIGSDECGVLVGKKEIEQKSTEVKICLHQGASIDPDIQAQLSEKGEQQRDIEGIAGEMVKRVYLSVGDGPVPNTIHPAYVQPTGPDGTAVFTIDLVEPLDTYMVKFTHVDVLDASKEIGEPLMVTFQEIEGVVPESEAAVEPSSKHTTAPMDSRELEAAIAASLAPETGSTPTREVPLVEGTPGDALPMVDSSAVVLALMEDVVTSPIDIAAEAMMQGLHEAAHVGVPEINPDDVVEIKDQIEKPEIPVLVLETTPPPVVEPRKRTATPRHRDAWKPEAIVTDDSPRQDLFLVMIWQVLRESRIIETLNLHGKQLSAQDGLVLEADVKSASAKADAGLALGTANDALAQASGAGHTACELLARLNEVKEQIRSYHIRLDQWADAKVTDALKDLNELFIRKGTEIHVRYATTFERLMELFKGYHQIFAERDKKRDADVLELSNRFGEAEAMVVKVTNQTNETSRLLAEKINNLPESGKAAAREVFEQSKVELVRMAVETILTDVTLLEKIEIRLHQHIKKEKQAALNELGNLKTALVAEQATVLAHIVKTGEYVAQDVANSGAAAHSAATDAATSATAAAASASAATASTTRIGELVESEIKRQVEAVINTLSHKQSELVEHLEKATRVKYVESVAALEKLSSTLTVHLEATTSRMKQEVADEARTLKAAAIELKRTQRPYGEWFFYAVAAASIVYLALL